MHSFLKAQASSLTASAADFSTTFLLLNFVDFFKVYYVTASVIGVIVGGITNFLVNRNWTFETGSAQPLAAASGREVILPDGKNHLSVQATRYLLVWLGNLALNAAGIYLLTHYMSVSPMISKIFVSLLVGFTYNYLLQKRFVFSKG